MKFTQSLKPSLHLLIGCLFAGVSANAQLNNAGGTITISDGASIICLGSATNSSGTITNDGKLEVRGSFVNSGTYNSTSNGDSLLLTDTGAVTLNSGASVINNLVINKTNGGGVTLGGNTTVNTKLDLLAGSFSTDPLSTYEFRAPTTATFSFAPGTEISGKVRRTGWINGTSVVFNQPNMRLTTNGGTAPTAILVNMVPNGNPTAAEREVSRAFSISADAGSGYTADVTFPYKSTELNSNNANNLVPWYFSSDEWIAKPTGNTINTTDGFITTTGIDATNFSNTEWKLADPRYSFNVTTLLRGSWTGSTMSMSTALNSGGWLPLSQPYNITPFNYAGTESVTAIPNANIVDWVLLELRKPASGLASDATSATIVGRKAAFLTNTGSIVDLDGVTPAFFDITKQGVSFVVVRHRNHLAVMSNAIPSNSAGTFANDFSALANSYKNPDASSDPETVLAGGSKYGLWAGDASKNGIVNAGDINLVKIASSNLFSGYRFEDVNMNVDVNAGDVNLSKATSSTLANTSVGSRSAIPADGTVKTHVPD